MRKSAVALSPTEITRRPLARAVSASCAAPGSSMQMTKKPERSSVSTKSSNAAWYAAYVTQISRWSASTLVTMAAKGR